MRSGGKPAKWALTSRGEHALAHRSRLEPCYENDGANRLDAKPLLNYFIVLENRTEESKNGPSTNRKKAATEMDFVRARISPKEMARSPEPNMNAEPILQSRNAEPTQNRSRGRFRGKDADGSSRRSDPRNG